MKGKLRKVDVKKGDKVYLWKSASFVNSEEKRELIEVFVMESNTSSIYVQRGTQKIRFNARTLIHRDGLGGVLKLYADPDEFYAEWDAKEENLKLRSEVRKLTESASSETLKEVHAILSANSK